ncbi:MAG: F0F1 ATP synthase subunit C [Alphaproteobacteria bacterium]|jgi:F-type H+-transporting ATPase subunit c|nr:F0F1 ATP synthase subunit C [Alphaproteobacteria bacterium]
MDVEVARLIGAGIAVLPLFGVGLGLGKLFASLTESIARNPSASSDLKSNGILSFALIESIALLSFVVAMIILFAV